MGNLTKPKADIIKISDLAAGRIKQLLEQRGKKSLGIRIAIKAGGCSGLSYEIEYADEKRASEEEIDDKGVKVLIDPKAVMYLLGTEMDFVEDQFKSGFVFNNPNEKGSCGCGKSFHV